MRQLATALLILGSTVLGVGGCAHQKVSQPEHSGNKWTVESEASPVLTTASSIRKRKIASSQKLSVYGVELENSKFDIPVVVNSKVEKWIDYFQGRGRRHFTKYLDRSRFFVPYLRKILAQNGMPKDLVYLAMIESGFHNHARSRARAVGPWQFIRPTGKRYGLMINWWVDERRDSHKSTLAAIRYLKDLYLIFGRWELAAAGYNAGESKVARAIRRYGSYDFWEISRHRFLRPETRNYVPKMFAAAIIAKNPEQFGFEDPLKERIPLGENGQVEPAENGTTEDWTVARSNIVSAKYNTRNENSEEESGNASDEAAALIVPVDDYVTGKGPLSRDNMEDRGEEEFAAEHQRFSPIVNRKGELDGESLVEFEVQSPADMLKIARAAGIPYQTLRNLNPEVLRWCTPPMVSTYRVKLPTSSAKRFMETYNHPAYPRNINFVKHRVKRGETLSRIARRYGIGVRPLSDLNGVNRRARLRKGRYLTIPIPNDRSRSISSLHLKDPPRRRRRRRKRRRRRRRSRSAQVQTIKVPAIHRSLVQNSGKGV